MSSPCTVPSYDEQRHYRNISTIFVDPNILKEVMVFYFNCYLYLFIMQTHSNKVN